MSNHSVIEHRANYHYIKVEEDYVQICSQGKESPYCKALILAVLEHWINDKRTKGQDEYIYMTYPQWIENLYQFFGRNVIIKSLNELAKQHFILRRIHRYDGKESFAYILNIPQVQAAIKALPDKDGRYTRPKINASQNKRVPNETGVKVNGTEETGVYFGTADASKKGRFLESITELQKDIDSEGTFVANATPAPSPDAAFAEEDGRDTPTEMRVPAVHIETASHIATHNGYTNEGDDDAPACSGAAAAAHPGDAAAVDLAVVPITPSQQTIPDVLAGAAHAKEQASDAAATASPSHAPPASDDHGTDAGKKPFVRREPARAPLQSSFKLNEKAMALTTRELRDRYEAHFWTLLEGMRAARGLDPFGRGWRAKRYNQDGVNDFYADHISDEAIVRAYTAVLDSKKDTWLKENFTVPRFYERLQGLLDGQHATNGRTSEATGRPRRRNFSQEYAQEQGGMH